MAETSPLAQRIQAEFDARSKRQKESEQQRNKETESREKGIAQFDKICEDLKAVWRPRFDEFAKQFGDKIKVTPSVSPTQREAKIIFMTDMATMNLTLTVAPSSDVTKLVLDYDLFIVPIFFDYERHARLEVPFDKIDKAAIGKWIDDQLISCVKAYLTMQENEIYMERARVEDPITKVKLLREDAKWKLDHGGRVYYFSSEQSFQQFKKEHQPEENAPAPKPAATAGAGSPAANAKAPEPAVAEPKPAAKSSPGGKAR